MLKGVGVCSSLWSAEGGGQRAFWGREQVGMEVWVKGRNLRKGSWVAGGADETLAELADRVD